MRLHIHFRFGITRRMYKVMQCRRLVFTYFFVVNRDILRNKTEIMIIKFAGLIYFIILYLITSIYTVCVHNYVTECPAEDLRR